MIRRLAIAAVLAGTWGLAAAPAFADQTADIFGGSPPQAKSTDPIQVDAQSLETYEEGTQRISVFSAASR